MRHRAIGRMGLLLFGTLLGLCLAEVTVRVLDLPPRPLSPLPIANYQLSKSPEPNQKSNQKLNHPLRNMKRSLMKNYHFDK